MMCEAPRVRRPRLAAGCVPAVGFASKIALIRFLLHASSAHYALLPYPLRSKPFPARQPPISWRLITPAQTTRRLRRIAARRWPQHDGSGAQQHGGGRSGRVLSLRRRAGG